MASLRSDQGCSPAEALQTSQGETSTNALRTSRFRGSNVWNAYSVTSLDHVDH